MSTPTTRSFTSAEGGGTPYEINDFVNAVRANLDDLSPDEVTELTGGLEADLTDGLAEADSTLSQLYGDPAEYAGELRAAAGLPPRGAGRQQSVAKPGLAVQLEQGFVLPIQAALQQANRQLDAQPWWPGAREFLISIRPAWWVVRAWVVVEALFVVYGMENSAIRGGFGGLVLVLAAIVVSVQMARHTPLSATWLRVLAAAWNLVAVLLLLPILFTSSGDSNVDYAGDDSGATSTGLIINGTPVNNVFPYDSAGRPLTGVQLFDQDGRPLEVGEDDRGYLNEQDGKIVDLVPGSPVGSAPRWNAFPLQQRQTDDDTGNSGPIEPAPLPLTGVPSLESTPSATPSASPTQGPTPSAIPAPSASAEPKSTAKAKTEDEPKSK